MCVLNQASVFFIISLWQEIAKRIQEEEELRAKRRVGCQSSASRGIFLHLYYFMYRAQRRFMSAYVCVWVCARVCLCMWCFALSELFRSICSKCLVLPNLSVTSVSQLLRAAQRSCFLFCLSVMWAADIPQEAIIQPSPHISQRFPLILIHIPAFIRSYEMGPSHSFLSDSFWVTHSTAWLKWSTESLPSQASFHWHLGGWLAELTKCDVSHESYTLNDLMNAQRS